MPYKYTKHFDRHHINHTLKKLIKIIFDDIGNYQFHSDTEMSKYIINIVNNILINMYQPLSPELVSLIAFEVMSQPLMVFNKYHQKEVEVLLKESPNYQAELFSFILERYVQVMRETGIEKTYIIEAFHEAYARMIYAWNINPSENDHLSKMCDSIKQSFDAYTDGSKKYQQYPINCHAGEVCKESL